MKIIAYLLIGIIKIYKFFISPFMSPSCRYFPACSEYFINSLKTHSLFKAIYLGVKRILSCHPIKFLGGGEGFDPVPIKPIKVKNNGK